jgi:starch synthase (maltosyl-transferring)
MMNAGDGRRRVVIEGVKPEIDAGRYPIKRVVGEKVIIEADVFTDGHDLVSAVLLYRRDSEETWDETPMTALVNDRWRAEFTVSEVGRYRYTIRGWVDHFLSWRRDLAKRLKAGQKVDVDLLIGAELIEEAAAQAHGADQTRQSAARRTARTGHHRRRPAATDAPLGSAPLLHHLRARAADQSRSPPRSL